MKHILLLLLAITSTFAADKNKHIKQSAIQDGKLLDVNQVECCLQNNGTLGENPATGGNGFFFPKGQRERSLVYTSGLWIMGKVDGELRAGVSFYYDNFQPGQILDDGHPGDAIADEYPIYKYDAGDTVNKTAIDQGAPSHTLGDQMLYCVFNDSTGIARPDWEGVPGMGLEVQQTLYGFHQPGALDRTVITHFRIIHKGRAAVDSAYISFFIDPDIGESDDDAVGSDPARQMIYAYNGDNFDIKYGASPPVLGCTLLKATGPNGPESLSSTNIWIKSSSNPAFKGSETDPAIAWCHVQGLRSDSTPWTETDGGSITRFPLDGDPIDGTGSTFDDISAPCDIRMLLNTGPYTLSPGDTATLTLAFVVGDGLSLDASLQQLRDSVDELHQPSPTTLQLSPEPFSYKIDGTLHEEDKEFSLSLGRAHTLSGKIFQNRTQYRGRLIRIQSDRRGTILYSPSEEDSSFSLSFAAVPQTLTVAFETEYRLSLESSVGTPSGQGYYTTGTTVDINIEPEVIQGNTRYRFTGWYDQDLQLISGQPGFQHTTTTYEVITAHWQTQHYVSLSCNPDTLGTLSPPPPGLWVNQGESVCITATPTDNACFDGWSGAITGLENPITLTVTAPLELTAQFSTQNTVNMTINTQPENRQYTVDGLPQTGISQYDWTKSSPHSISGATVQMGCQGYRYRFDCIQCGTESTTYFQPADASEDFSWSFSATPSLNPISLCFNSEYALILLSAYGTPQGSGWYAANDTVTISIEPIVSNGMTRHLFNGWTGSYSSSTAQTTLIMRHPKTLSVEWLTQHFVSISCLPDSLGSTIPCSPGLWVNEGDTLMVEAQGDILKNSQFKHWQGASNSQAAQLSLVVMEPINLTACFECANTAVSATLPVKMLLHAYPNPFNPSTVVQLNLNRDSQVNLDIFDCRGRHVTNLYNGYKTAGKHAFHWDAQAQPTGLYLCRARIDKKILIKKLLLQK